MMKYINILIISLLLTGCGSCNRDSKNTAYEVPLTENLDSALIRNFIAQHPQFDKYHEKILNFYRKRNFRMIWSINGEFVPQADMFINVIEQVEDYGLTMDSSLVQSVRDSILYLKDAPKPLSNRLMFLQKHIDLVLTAEYFLLAPQLIQGLVDPSAEDSIEWHIDPKQIQYTQLLDSILNGRTSNNPFIHNKRLHPQVEHLKKVLAKYRDIDQKGGWPVLSDNHYPAPGDTGTAVRLLARRLLITNDIVSFDTLHPVYNSTMEQGVKNFQKRHGLKTSGIVDSITRVYLNVPVEDKLKQILVNMERMRWIPGSLEKNYILVNIPDYRLIVYRNGKPIESMKIIVGKTGSNTVIFQGKIKYIVVNPYWNIPKSIAVKEILPEIKKNKGYLKEHQMEVGQKWNFQAVDQDTINWEHVTEENFNYTLRQSPGENNPLGRIKFLFPNQFSIYLHDTPNDKLFSETEREFSHGCIRIEKPLDLAHILLDKNNLEKRKKISELLISGKNERITLDTPVSVYILYFTAWVDQDGIYQFRKDVYGHDWKLAQRIFQPDHEGGG